MKVSSIKEERPFAPVKILLTIETEKELQESIELLNGADRRDLGTLVMLLVKELYKVRTDRNLI